MHGGIKGTDSTIISYQRTQYYISHNWKLLNCREIIVNQQKTGKIQMRAKFKLHYKECFYSSGSPSFELRVRNNIQPQRVKIPLGTWSEDTHHFVLFRSPGAATLLHIRWYYSLSSLIVTLSCHWRGKLCHVCSVLQRLATLFECWKAKALASF